MSVEEHNWALQRVREHLIASAELKRRVVDECMTDILAAAERIAVAFREEGKLLLCGNGGSAADCQHLAGEFLSVLTQAYRRPGLAAVSLTGEGSYLTAYANDFGFEGAFARQVAALGRRGDALLAISTSGGSKNVVLAAETAREAGLSVIALMGAEGPLAKVADVAVCVPGDCTPLIQESHLAIEHCLCDLIERRLYGPEGT